jgi:hypothetical protein
MPWMAAAAAVGGALISSKASDRASSAQAAASREASALEHQRFLTARDDSAPFRGAGTDAVNRLRFLMGLGGDGTRTREQIVSDLRSSGRYNIPGQSLERGTPFELQMEGGNLQRFRFADGSESDSGVRLIGSNSFDEAAMAAEADRVFGSQVSGNPEYGSLNRRFSIADFDADPVNQLGLRFGQEEGSKAIRRMFGASGMGRSGPAAKALTRFGVDYGNTKAGESRGRFMQDQDVVFNRLSGIAGTGQTATAQNNALSLNSAQSVGQNIVGAGNARGAAAIAGGNAFTNAAGQIGNTAMTKYYLDSLRPSTPYSSPYPDL